MITRLGYNQLKGQPYKKPCRVSTEVNISNLNGGSPNIVDGITLLDGDRVLVKAQNTTSQNGIYFVSSVGTGSNGVWVRDNDLSTNDDLVSGFQVFIIEGTLNGGKGFYLESTGSLIINSSNLEFGLSQAGQGEQGPQGAQGAQGNQGDIGAQGNQGTQGNQGDIGAQGAQGNQGDIGAQGAQGTQGNQGDIGAQGASNDMVKYVQATGLTYSASTNENTIIGTALTGSVIIPSNFFEVGTILRVTSYGLFNAVAGSTTAASVRVYLDSGTPIQLNTTSSIGNIRETRAYRLEFDIICESTGATGSVSVGGHGISTSTGLANSSTVIAKGTTDGLTTINTTVDYDLDVTIQFNTDSYELFVHKFTIETLKPVPF
jgi:hypothetical protein